MKSTQLDVKTNLKIILFRVSFSCVKHSHRFMFQFPSYFSRLLTCIITTAFIVFTFISAFQYFDSLYRFLSSYSFCCMKSNASSSIMNHLIRVDGRLHSSAHAFETEKNVWTWWWRLWNLFFLSSLLVVVEPVTSIRWIEIQKNLMTLDISLSQ